MIAVALPRKYDRITELLMRLEGVLTGAIEVACVALPSAAFFFFIIGVFGLQAAIAGVIIFIVFAFSIIRGTAKKDGTNDEA
jgi:ABC-type proline/glycine betaine transport system permease subunit